mmetsp:Transcript_31231/g.70651  ORF Transcript_31231/g.70651 Transcript_31231/m.70651 type:complete len:228 (+) Transcript_31231:1240-1923(+)
MNSVAVSPEKKELATKPLAGAVRLWYAKCGSVLFTNPSCIRCPPTACWPTHAIICEMFNGLPLEPHSAIIRGVLAHGSAFIASWPADSRSLPRIPFSTSSRDCKRSHPGRNSNVPSSYCLIACSAFWYPVDRISCFIFLSLADGDTSDIPMENPLCIPKYREQSLENRSMNLAASSGPQSRSRTYRRPVLLPSPIVFFAMLPDTSSLFRNATQPSFGQKCFIFFDEL